MAAIRELTGRERAEAALHPPFPGGPVVVHERLLVLLRLELPRGVGRDLVLGPERVGDRLEADGALQGEGGEHGPADVLASDDDAVVAQERGTPRAQRLRDAAGPGTVGHELRALVERPDAVHEEDRVMGEDPQRGIDRAECRAVDRVAVDDGVHVRAGAIDLGVHDRLEVVAGSLERVGVVEVERDDVVGLDLVEGEALALDPDDPRAGLARADVTEREVDVALERDDPAGDRDGAAELVAHRRAMLIDARSAGSRDAGTRRPCSRARRPC